MFAATLIIGGQTVVTSCSNDDADVRPLTEWQAGRTVCSEDCTRFIQPATAAEMY